MFFSRKISVARVTWKDVREEILRKIEEERQAETIRPGLAEMSVTAASGVIYYEQSLVTPADMTIGPAWQTAGQAFEFKAKLIKEALPSYSVEVGTAEIIHQPAISEKEVASYETFI